MIANKIASKDQIEAIEADAKKIVEDSVKFAENGTEPKLESLYDHLYANGEIIK